MFFSPKTPRKEISLVKYRKYNSHYANKEQMDLMTFKFCGTIFTTFLPKRSLIAFLILILQLFCNGDRAYL